MVRLGPIREEACAVLAIAREVCEDHESEVWGGHSFVKPKISMCAIQNPLVNLIDSAESFEEWVTSDEPWISDWVRNVCRFCADVLRWAHETERAHEVLALNVLSGMCVSADPDTKAPTNGGWAHVAYCLSEFLGYDVKANNGVTLRHGRLSFDREKRTFVFSWG